MRIAYLTLDEVNCSLAQQLADDLGMTLDPRSFRDPPPDGRCDRVLYDLDSFPEAERHQVLTRLLATLSLCPVAVHSYNLDKEQIRGLRRNGVAVHPRLGKAVFLKLARQQGTWQHLDRARA